MQRNCLRRVLGTLCFLLLVLTAHAQKYTVTGGQGTPLLAIDNNKGAASDKLQVYLVYGMDNVEIRYTPTSSSYQWYRYKNKVLEGEPISSIQEGGTTVIRNLEEGYGYYVKESDAIGGVSGYVWIIDYSQYAFNVTSFYVDTQKSSCDNMFFGGTGDMKEMRYTTPSGSSTILQREFLVTYQTMERTEDELDLIPVTVTDTINNPFSGYTRAPYYDTDVTLKGDLFAQHFGVEKVITSDVYQAVAVDAVVKIDTVSYASDVPNLVVKGDSLSAPVEFNFTAIANTPVAAVFKWTISQKNEGGKNTPLSTSPNEDVNYVFNQNGTYFVDLEISDRTLACTWKLEEPITINISDTYIDVPNAFSPGTTPGINDEFRVAYRSLTRFKCWIFNRWGAEIYYWTDPSKGWDGKKGGKYVAPGVYFYVIEATGSDGKSIKKKGSINILRSKRIDDEIIEE